MREEEGGEVTIGPDGISRNQFGVREDRMPRLDAYDTGTVYAVWCKYCLKYHTHSRENGSRVAHCHRDTPYRDSEYLIVKVGMWKDRPPHECGKRHGIDIVRCRAKKVKA